MLILPTSSSISCGITIFPPIQCNLVPCEFHLCPLELTPLHRGYLFLFLINLLFTGLLFSDTLLLGGECLEPLGSAWILFSLVPFLFPSSICLYYCVGMCRDDWDEVPGMELGGLEGSGTYIIYKIDLPVQSVTVIIIIIIFCSWSMLFFPFRLLTLFLHFNSKFLYFMCRNAFVGHCTWKLQKNAVVSFSFKKKETNRQFIRKNPLAHLKGLTTLFS